MDYFTTVAESDFGTFSTKKAGVVFSATTIPNSGARVTRTYHDESDAFLTVPRNLPPDGAIIRLDNHRGAPEDMRTKRTVYVNSNHHPLSLSIYPFKSVFIDDDLARG